MTPEEAGFDGAKGVNMNVPGMLNGGLFKLRRGTAAQWRQHKDTGNFRNQFLWLEEEPAQLLYCNLDGQWFELSFSPLKPGDSASTPSP